MMRRSSIYLAKLAWAVTGTAAPLAAQPRPIDARPDAKFVEVQGRSVADVIKARPDLSTYAKALDATGLLPGLAGAGPFTLFAPSNAAFAALAKDERDSFMEDAAQLRERLRYHVVSGYDIESGDLRRVDGARLKTEAEQFVQMRTGADAAYVSDFSKAARIQGGGTAARNGVVYVIDSVLTPPSDETAVPIK